MTESPKTAPLSPPATLPPAGPLRSGRALLCVGAANLDRKLRALAPLRMGTSNPARADESFGGVARNIAENLARLGVPVALASAVGDDAAGRALLAHAGSAGIDTRATLEIAGARSGTYTALLDEGGEMAVALADMDLYDALGAAFIAGLQPWACAALAVADLNLPHDSVAALLERAARDALPLVLVAVSEPKMTRLPRDLSGLRLLILNEGELAARTGAALSTLAGLEDACRAVQRQGARDVVVTRGERGVAYTSAGGVACLEAPRVDVLDVTGAGDAFAAGVCWSLFQGSDDLGLACRRGLRLAAMTLASGQAVCPLIGPRTLDDLPGPSHAPYQD